MNETSSPVDLRWLSPSADDVIPTSLHAAYTKQPYPGEPTGAGRVHDLLDPMKKHVGTLWTNDKDGAGLTAADNENPVHQTHVALLLREMNPQGVPAGAAFDAISIMDAPYALEPGDSPTTDEEVSTGDSR
ncbi:MAG: hypothetical protein INR66_02975 [Gordonia polyisoprenivorans]|nr:hypothetical protein [Gordonia polyisoprenivorans]